MLFGKKKTQKREGALDPAEIIEVIQTLSVNDGCTVERINWDGSRTVVSGRVTHVSTDATHFAMVEEGTGEAVEFGAEIGDIASIRRMAISIDLDEHQTESYMEVDTIIQLLEALEHGDTITVSYYDDLRGRGVSRKGVITLKDEYNKLFAIEYDDNGEKKEQHFNLNQDRIIDIIME